ncbi:MAG: hypothetical protein GEU87_09325 [Alphaproteobacteria bacterium]|nr:hypothetical protein [Alphaproteobacteria bacterium]
MEMQPSDLPSFAIGDSFTFDNPDETWTVSGIQDGLVIWRSSLGGSRKTVFAPFVPPIEWTAKGNAAGEERLTGWGDGLFPLKGGKKTAFRTRARMNGEADATPFEWKCYSGNPRKVTVKAGAYAAYPLFCRRNDGLTTQSFYAPEVNAPLMITQRKRPAPAETRELVGFKLATGPRIAATPAHGLPKGVALAAVEPAARPAQPAGTAVADAGGAPVAPSSAPSSTPASTPASASPPAAALAPPPQIAHAAAQRPPAIAARPAAPVSSGTPTIAPPPRIGPPAAATPPVIALAPPASATTPADKVEPRAASGPTLSAGFGAQIASYQVPANVERGWVSLRQRHGPLLDSVGHVVRRVELGGGKGVFHRLLAGPFPARSSAEQLCRSIRSRGAGCIVQPLEG